jgi:L-ribulose-5-phosphate 3-epimerase
LGPEARAREATELDRSVNFFATKQSQRDFGNDAELRIETKPMQLTRRSLLGAVTSSTLALASGAEARPWNRPAKTRIKLGISTYSYWHFRGAKVPVETVIDKAADLGVEGVDILHRQMEMKERDVLTSAERAYLQRLKRHSFRNGIDLICLSIHQDFCRPGRRLPATGD